MKKRPTIEKLEKQYGKAIVQMALNMVEETHGLNGLDLVKSGDTDLLIEYILMINSEA